MNKRHSKLAQQWVNAALAIIIVGLLAWLSVQFKTEFDWTYGHRNTLTPASQKLLTALPGPIHFYGFVFQEEANARKAIDTAVSKYQAFKSNVKLTFIDPSRQPQQVKKFGVSQPGQLVVEYDGRHEALDKVSEPEISEALERLAQASKTTVAFLTGAGERSPKASNRNGYSFLADKLRNKGFKVTTLNLATQPKIPASVSALVIADPTSQMLPQQDAAITRYVKAGGNLLWLADTGHKPGLPELAKLLGVDWLPGFVIFPNFRQLGMGGPGIYLSAQYPRNPVTGKLKEITVFPLVRGLSYGKNKAVKWHSMPMLTTSKKAWLNTQVNKKVVKFDPSKGDIKGPLTIGLAQTRNVPKTAAARSSVPATASSTAAHASGSDKNAAAKDKTPRQQRVAMVGDADFLANGNFNLLGNSALGMDILSWVSGRNTSLSIEIPKAPDRNLYLPGWARWMISAGYVVILPLILILFGVSRWAIRRRR